MRNINIATFYLLSLSSLNSFSVDNKSQGNSKDLVSPQNKQLQQNQKKSAKTIIEKNQMPIKTLKEIQTQQKISKKNKDVAKIKKAEDLKKIKEAVLEPMYLYNVAIKVVSTVKSEIREDSKLWFKTAGTAQLAAFWASYDLWPKAYHNELVLTFKEIKNLKEKPTRHRKDLLKPTFLIDFNEINFTEVKRQIEKIFGKTPSVQQLKDFSFYYIKNRIGFRGMDIASFIVKNQSGNTNEYATLLTALLRMYKIPAAIFRGIVFKMHDAQGLMGFGRSWVVYQDIKSKTWNRLDPLSEIEKRDGKKTLGYLPLFEITDESPSYKNSLSLLKDQSVLSISLK